MKAVKSRGETMKAKKATRAMKAMQATMKKPAVKAMKAQARKKTMKKPTMQPMKPQATKAVMKTATMKPRGAEATKRNKATIDEISAELRAELNACGKLIFQTSSGRGQHCLAEVIGVAWNDEEKVKMYEVLYENGSEAFLYETEFRFVDGPTY
jgi:hypothetical protein